VNTPQTNSQASKLHTLWPFRYNVLALQKKADVEAGRNVEEVGYGG
jgi:hypothetical protein